MSKPPKTELQKALDRIAYLEESIDCFLKGRVNGSTDPARIALAKWGNKRLEWIKKTPKLLLSD